MTRGGALRRPGHARPHRAAPVAALLLAFATMAGCGQRGPLTLPDSARPIERLDPAQRPQPSADGARSGAAAPAQPGAEDDEADDSDEAAENER